MPAGIEAANRAALDRLHQTVTGPFSVAEAAIALSLDHARARRLLASLASSGWLSRIRRGLYSLVPLGATSPSEWREDPWVVAQKAFSPCYIGGWSACEHWSLTEQIFRDVLVVTSRSVRKRLVEFQGARFQLKVLPEAQLFGMRSVWRGQVRVLVSDPSRTIVDLLDDPVLGGGIRHVAQMLTAYFSAEFRDDKVLLDYLMRRGNGTAFKRLGFLLETADIKAPSLLEACRLHQSAGLSRLDPSVHQQGRIVKRWRLWVNLELTATGVAS